MLHKKTKQQKTALIFTWKKNFGLYLTLYRKKPNNCHVNVNDKVVDLQHKSGENLHDLGVRKNFTSEDIIIKSKYE